MSPRHTAIVKTGLVLFLAMLPMAGAFAVEPSNICDFYGYTDDPDPTGTNVRSGPGTDNPVLTVLPQSIDADGFTPQFHIIGFDNGWFEIEDVNTGDYDGIGAQKLFAGPGWISASLVYFDIEDQYLTGAPSPDAAKTIDLIAEPWAAKSVFLEKVHACQGRFVDVTLTNRAGLSARGWASDVCGNQATTCS